MYMVRMRLRGLPGSLRLHAEDTDGPGGASLLRADYLDIALAVGELVVLHQLAWGMAPGPNRHTSMCPDCLVSRDWLALLAACLRGKQTLSRWLRAAGKPTKLAFEGPASMRCVPGEPIGTLKAKLMDAYCNLITQGPAHVYPCCQPLVCASHVRLVCQLQQQSQTATRRR